MGRLGGAFPVAAAREDTRPPHRGGLAVEMGGEGGAGVAVKREGGEKREGQAR